MDTKNQITEQESIAIIASMIQKAKGSYQDTGIGPILWGTVIAFNSFVTWLQLRFQFSIGFDIWILALIAIIPQVIISIREKKMGVVKKYEDDALNAVWLVFGLSIFALSAYRIIVPGATTNLIAKEGWQLVKHYTSGQKPDEAILPFVPSFYSVYILLYAFPTLVTALVKKFRPMLWGAVLSYGLFIVSCFTSTQYDMLLGTITAVSCWLIPGIILRRRYLDQKKQRADV